jgi:hypothetical protein
MEHEDLLRKYTPLWYGMMCMKAFCDGDRELAEFYYEMSQEILRITGSVQLPLAHEITIPSISI